MRRLPFADALSFVVFPFFKTSEAVPIGEFTFRPVGDPGSLSGDDLVRLGEISKMFFLRDDKRIVSPTYCTVPHIDFDYDRAALERLSDIQAVIAYLYGAPHEIFGHPFLQYEDASLVILTPDEVSSYLVNPDRFVEQVGEYLGPEPKDALSGVPGYSGLYNFRERFWCIRTANISSWHLGNAQCLAKSSF